MIQRITFDVIGALLITLGICLFIGAVCPGISATFTGGTSLAVMGSILLIKWGLRLMSESGVGRA